MGREPRQVHSQPISVLPGRWIQLQACDHPTLQPPSYSSQSAIHWPCCTGSAGHCFRSASELLPHGLSGMGIPSRGLCLVGMGQGGMGIPGVLLGVLSFLGAILGGSSALHWYNTSCHLARPTSVSCLGSLSFLGADARGLALFHAHWDGHGRLQACSRQDEPELTAAFRALCAGEITQGFFIHTPGPELQTALATVRSQWGACRPPEESAAGASAAGAREKRAAGQSGTPGIAQQRGKRGWTMPGTLWCGVGDSAGNSTELGEPSGCGLGV